MAEEDYAFLLGRGLIKGIYEVFEELASDIECLAVMNDRVALFRHELNMDNTFNLLINLSLHAQFQISDPLIPNSAL